MQKFKKKKIYVDMDGVLADFDKHFENLFGMGPREFEDKYGRVAFWDKINGVEDFFALIPAFEGMLDFFKEILKLSPHVMILSSPSSTNTDECKDQKRFWLMYHIIKHVGQDFGIIFEKDKHIYAETNSVLIDDYRKKIDAWTQAGGVAIHHTGNYTATLNALKLYLR